MKFFHLLIALVVGCSSLLKAELPTHPDLLGTFALFDDRKVRFRIKTDGVIEIKPMKDRKTEVARAFDVVLRLQVRDKGKTRWVTKRVQKETFQPIGSPTTEPEQAMGYKVKVTGGYEYQVLVEETKKGQLVKAWISNLTPDEEEQDADGEAEDQREVKEREVRLVWGIRMANLFFRLATKDGEETIKKRTKGSELRFLTLDKEREKFDFSQPIELTESGLEKGFKAVEIRSKRMGRLRSFTIAPEDQKEGSLQLINYRNKPIFVGLTVGKITPINELGSADSKGLLISYK